VVGQSSPVRSEPALAGVGVAVLSSHRAAVVDTRIGHSSSSERTHAIEHLEYATHNALMLYDRGYPACGLCKHALSATSFSASAAPEVSITKFGTSTLVFKVDGLIERYWAKA